MAAPGPSGTMAGGKEGYSVILDQGPCEIWDIVQSEPDGEYPREILKNPREAFYGELSFSTFPTFETDYQESVEIDRKIRILRDLSVNRQTAVLVGGRQYKVQRVYHGYDEDSGEDISDVSLSKVVTDYEKESGLVSGSAAQSGSQTDPGI